MSSAAQEEMHQIVKLLPKSKRERACPHATQPAYLTTRIVSRAADDAVFSDANHESGGPRETGPGQGAHVHWCPRADGVLHSGGLGTGLRGLPE